MSYHDEKKRAHRDDALEDNTLQLVGTEWLSQSKMESKLGERIKDEMVIEFL